MTVTTTPNSTTTSTTATIATATAATATATTTTTITPSYTKYISSAGGLGNIRLNVTTLAYFVYFFIFFSPVDREK